METEIPSHLHGLYNTYSNRKCRCDPCRLAGNAYMRSWRAAKKLAGTRGDLCEICGSSNQIVLDHEHATGKFRGWLCHSCNVAVGKLGDSAEGVARAIDYLTRKSLG